MKVNGRLLFSCNDYFTVDEYDLPTPDKYRDGLRKFKLQSYCCNTLQKYDDEYHYCILMNRSVYPDILKTGDIPKLILQTTAGESDDECEFEIPNCPWCGTQPIYIIEKRIKRIKRCKQKIVPASIEEVCEIEEKEV